jgi:hypothetical protein
MLLGRRKRKLRLHLVDRRESIEGIFLGYEAGHYRIVNANYLRESDQTLELEGEAWVPRERVLWAQVTG